MTRDQAHDLAERIRREANSHVLTRIGRTNGAYLIHVIDRDAGRSVNIASLGEWLLSPLNKNNKPPRAKRPCNPDRDLADQDTIQKGLNTIYDPED